MLHIILIAIAVIVVLFLIIVAMQPADFRITRSAAISATPEKVFPLVNVLKSWEIWSPWAKMDPNAKHVYEGPAAGIAAIMRWSGNRKVGVGVMTITESRPDELLRIKLDFLKPFKVTNIAEFTFQAQGGQTLVTWSMSGENNFMGKVFGLIINCDKMIGGDFEKGLAKMKWFVELASKK
jgi:hypothetical protein